MTRLLVAAAIVVSVMGGCWLVSPEAAEKQLFEEGKTYSVVWNCSPGIQAYIYTPEPKMAWVAPPGCYSERLKIVDIRKDGWMEAVDLADNSVWAFNIAQAIARRIYVPKAEA